MEIELLKYFNQYKNKYKSQSQLIRVITENWCEDNMYCPFCSSDRIKSFPNNYPVADFYCEECGEEFQLKSKRNGLGKIITDGEYNKMIDAIYLHRTPNFFFLSYTGGIDYIEDLLVIPKEFILPNAIQKRKPLSENARRAGWTGCNIILDSIPDYGKVFAVKEKKIIQEDNVRNNIISIDFMRKLKNINSRGWINDILLIVSEIQSDVFTLQQVYEYENILKRLHPENNNIRAKIRQQLQILRDNNVIEFIHMGVYRKCHGSIRI